MDPSQDLTISVCGVGKYRTTAEEVAPILKGTPFRFAAMLDTTSPEPYDFAPDRLRLVLRSVYPPPRCFIAGEAVEEHVNAAAIEVWREFVAEKKIENPLLINLREFEGKSIEETQQIPKDQLMAQLLTRHLKSHFFGP